MSRTRSALDLLKASLLSMSYRRLRRLSVSATSLPCCGGTIWRRRASSAERMSTMGWYVDEICERSPGAAEGGPSASQQLHNDKE